MQTKIWSALLTCLALTTTPAVYGQNLGQPAGPIAPETFQVNAASILGGFRVPLSDFAAVSVVSEQLRDLKRETWSGVALAAALTPVLPANGKQNHFNVSGSSAGGYQALSANYARTAGDVSFVAGVATTGKFSLGKVGVGISW